MVWKTVKLGDILTQKRGRRRIDPGNNYKQITVRLWGKGLTLRGVCAGSEIAADSQVEAKAGDFLISKIDARHGAFGLVPDALDGATISSDFPCFSVNRAKIDPRYLEWFSKTDGFVALCKQASLGSTNRVRLAEGRFLDLDIPLPSLDEQHEIIQRLTDVQTKLNEHKTTLEMIERDTNTLLFNVFQRVINGVAWKFLGDVAPLVRRPVEVRLDEEYPELGVRSFGKGTFHKPSLSGADVGSKRLFEIHEGDLLFNIVFAWEGAIAVPGPNDHKRVGSHRFLTCIPRQDVAIAEFLRYYLLTPEGLQKVGEASPGGAGRNRTLGVKKAELIRVPIPTIDAQRRFCELIKYVNQIRFIRVSMSNDTAALLPAMLHEIFGGQGTRSKVPPTAPPTNVISFPNSGAIMIDTPFKEAVLVGAIVKAFHTDGGQPLGNFRLQKAVYFARRHMGESALDKEYLRKAAGPYNPSMRYSGGIKIATDKKWVARATGKFGEGSTLGASAADMDTWIEKYQIAPAAAWVRDRFKFKTNDIWEALATVDYAMLALEHAGVHPTPAAILAYIENDPEWRPKIAKLRLSEASVQNAIVELQSLFIGALPV